MREKQTQQKQEDGEVQINLGEIFSYFLQKWFIILIALVIGAAGGFAIGSFLPKYYTEEAAYSVSYAGAVESVNDVTNSTNAVTKVLIGCQEFTKYNIFQDALNDKLKINYGYDYDTEDISGMVTFTTSVSTSSSSSNTGNFIYITVKTKAPQLSYDIMATILDMYPDFIKENYKQTSDVEMVFSPMSHIVPVEELVGEREMGRTTCTLIGGLGCAVIAMVVLAIICITDSRVKSDDELTEKYGAAILAAIPDYYDKNLSGGGEVSMNHTRGLNS